jgi:phosphate transport system substrate-binding protein
MIRRLLLAAAIAAFSVGASTPNAQQVNLTGAGSTFAYPLYSSWSSEFHKLHPNVAVNYQSIGSGVPVPVESSTVFA